MSGFDAGNLYWGKKEKKIQKKVFERIQSEVEVGWPSAEVLCFQELFPEANAGCVRGVAGTP